MNRADLVKGVLLWEQVAAAAKAKAAGMREQLSADAVAEFEEQGTAPTWRLKDIGTVVLPVSAETPYVADLEALTKWAAERYPTEVETVTQLRPTFVGALTARAVVDDGQVTDSNGEVIPGFAIREGGQAKALTIRAEHNARTVMRVAAENMIAEIEAGLTGGGA